MCSDCVCEASRLNRSYSNRSVCSEHKGQVLAHEPVEAWGTKQCILVSRLLAITHTDCQLLHQVDKPFSSSGITDRRICLGKLRLWRVGKTRLFVPPRFLLSFLFFFFSFSALPLHPFLESCPVQQLPLAVRLKMIGFILWGGVHCRPGAAVGSFSRWKSPFTHPLSPHEVSRLFTWSQRHFTDRRTFQRFHTHWQEVEFNIRWGFDYMNSLTFRALDEKIQITCLFNNYEAKASSLLA